MEQMPPIGESIHQNLHVAGNVMAIGRRTENQIIASFDCFFDPGGIVQSVQLDMIDTGGKLARSTIRRQDRRVIRRQNRPFRVNVRTDRILYQTNRPQRLRLRITRSDIGHHAGHVNPPFQKLRIQ